MLRLLIFGIMLSVALSYPLQEEVGEDNVRKIKELTQALNDVSYITNFKNEMSDYVKSQYKNLTVHDMEKIEEHLEEFCHEFAREVKDILENVAYNEGNKVEDGLPDATFDQLKVCIRNEIPNLEEDKVQQITDALRRILHETRKKIDVVIRNSGIVIEA